MIFGIYDIEIESKLIEEQQLSILKEIVSSQKEKITNFFNERLSDVIVSSNLPFIQNNAANLFGTDMVKKSMALEILKPAFETIRSTNGYNHIWMVDNNLQTHLGIGVDLHESSKPLTLPQFSQDVVMMKNGLYLSDVYLGPFLKTSEIFVSVPIIIDGVPLGYLIYDIDVTNFFKDTLFELELSKTGETVLVQNDGIDIHILNPLRFPSDTKMSINEIIQDIESPTYKATFDVRGSGLTTDYRLKEVLAAWDYVPLTRWGIVAKIDSAEAFAPVIQKQNDIAVVVVILTLSSLVVGLGLSRIAINPLKKIEDAATRIIQKNYDVEINPSGPKEHKTIAKSFNLMTKTLKVSINELESFRHALDESSDVAITDKNGIITFANDKFCQISKYSKKELIGKNHNVLKSGFHSEQFYKNMWNTICSGKVWHDQIQNKAKDGTIYWNDLVIVPIFNNNGEIQEYISIRRDITERINLHAQRVKDEKMITLGNFSSRLAHDMRNPLSIIQMSLDNIRLLYGEDKTKQESFKKIERSISRMVHQIDDVLNFVKEKPMKFNKTKTSKIIFDSLDSIIIPTAIEIVTPENDVDITCDEKQLVIAMNNLILNAIQSISDNGTIKIRVEEDFDEITIEVEDSGAGISADQLENIFEPLFTTKQHGTGLGLASVKAIIHSHGGIVSVTSSPTVFTIILPKVHDEEN